jgi:VCBS repeat-containing protein
MTIVLTNAMAGDALSVAGSLPGGITSSIDTSVAGQITLRLTNSASMADYQTALAQVRFANSSASPNTTDRDITVVLSESGGVNSNTAHATVHVIDATPPAKPPAPDLTDASDSGVSHTDNITNVAASTFTGTVEPGTTVRLYDSDGTTVIGTTLADASTGAYTVTSSALSQGTHHLTVTATDASNNTSVHSDALDVTIDTTAPAPTLTRADPATTFRNSTVHYTLSYPETTFGVDASDFTLTQSGGASGAAITGVTEPGGLGTPYAISVSTGTGLGTIEVDLRSSGTGISDTAGNLSGGATGPVYTIVNRAPVAHNDSVTLAASQTVLTGNLLANDTDADGDPLRVTSLIDYRNGVQQQVAVPSSGSVTLQSSHGAFTVSADGSYTYTANDTRPVQGHYAEDPLAYSISDGHGGTAGAQLQVNLAGQTRPSTETFNFNFVNATVSYGSDGQAYLTGPDGVTHNVTGVNTLVFNDGRIDEGDYNQRTTVGPPPGTSVPAGSALVDDLYYDSQYHDVYLAGIDPEQHYAQFGWHEGRNPDPYFNTNYYLSHNPDVAAAGINPLTHYDTSGWREGRDPSANFDTRDYQLAYPDVAAAGIDPLAHYLQFGELENRLTFPVDAGLNGPIDGFDPNYYLANNPDVAAAHINPFQHYLQYGWHEGRNPSADFNTNFYEAHNPDVAAAGIDPLIHYDQYGWHENRDPSAVFSTSGYLNTYFDVAAANINPLQHYLQYGMAEGRSPTG